MNPIKYSDLIQKDENTIQNLIDELGELIKKYDEARSRIQSAAAESARSMQSLSGATEEQRREILQLTEASNNLTEEYKKNDNASRQTFRAIQELKDASKEMQQIDKLLVQINREKEGSYNKLSAQYRLNKIRLNEMSAEERSATEAGKALEKETTPIYEEMNRLQKATGKAQLQVGQYERAMGSALGVNMQWIEVLGDSEKRSQALAGAMNFLKTPIMGVSAAVMAAVGAFKFWISTAHDTQTTGDALDYEVAAWTGSWDYFKKSVSTFDFRNFIRGAAEAADAGRELAKVLDEAFERKGSIDIRRSMMQEENELLLEQLRNAELSNEKRIEAGNKYLSNQKDLYNEEKELLADIEEKRLDDLFKSTNHIKGLSDAEENAQKQKLKDYIVKYNLDRKKIESAREYIQVEKDLEGQRTALAYAQTKSAREAIQERIAADKKIIDSATETQKELARIVEQYGLTNDKAVAKYRQSLIDLNNANAAFQKENRRIFSQIHSLQNQKEKDENKYTGVVKDARQTELETTVKSIDLQIAATESGTEKMYQLKIERLEAQRTLEIYTNSKLTKKERMDEALINAKYDKMRQDQIDARNAEIQKKEQEALDAEKSRREKLTKDEQTAWMKQLQIEMKYLDLEIAATDEGTEKMYRLRMAKLWKQKDIELAQNAAATKEMKVDEALIIAKYDHLMEVEAKKHGEDMAKGTSEGMAEGRKQYGDIWDVLGVKMDSDRKAAISTAINAFTELAGQIIDYWRQAAQAAVESADEQVSAAQKVLDAEIEARNNGYANNVATAQKELALAKKNREQALREEEKAQRAQLALDSVTQASSLITASANLWSSLSPIPIVGPALAIAALATMWASFAFSKIKAVQVTKQQKYGEGTVEMLEGGSHASGHDIDLGTKKDGTQRRAEGGEFFAIINKRNSRKYRNIIPDVINSLNDGTFTDRYQRASASMVSVGGTDVSVLERDVKAIRKQGEVMRFIDNRGNVVLQYKNLTRIEKK